MVGFEVNFYLGLLRPPSVRRDDFTRRTGPASFERLLCNFRQQGTRSTMQCGREST